MRPSVLPGIIVACCLLAACGDHSDQHSASGMQSNDHIISIDSDVTDLNNGSIRIGKGEVVVHANGAPDAVIDASGNLRIDQQPVTADATAQGLLKTYYENALTIRADAIATGKAGVAVGEQAAKSVLTRLASGHPDQIQHDIDSKTKLVKEAAAKICQDLRSTKVSQDQLAAGLAAFKPYGTVVSDADISECEKDLHD